MRLNTFHFFLSIPLCFVSIRLTLFVKNVIRYKCMDMISVYHFKNNLYFLMIKLWYWTKLDSFIVLILELLGSGYFNCRSHISKRYAINIFTFKTNCQYQNKTCKSNSEIQNIQRVNRNKFTWKHFLYWNNKTIKRFV